MSNTIATQFIFNDHSGLAPMAQQWTLEEAFGCGPIALCLKVDINHFAICNSSPQVMLLAADLHEDFIDVEGVTVATVLSFQSSGIKRTEINAPQVNSFTRDDNPTFGKKVFNIAMAKIESVVEPNCVADDV